MTSVRLKLCFLGESCIFILRDKRCRLWLRRQLCPHPHSGHGRREIVGNRTTYHFPLVKEKPVVSLATPRNAWCGWDLGDPDPSKPSTLPRTLSRARNMTVTTVIDRTGEAYNNNRRTTVGSVGCRAVIT